MKFLFVLVQLNMNKHEAKCTLQILWHWLLFCSLLLIEILRLCSSAEARVVFTLFLIFLAKMSLVFL